MFSIQVNAYMSLHDMKILRHSLEIKCLYRFTLYPKAYNITIWILFSSSLCLTAGTEGECGVTNVVVGGDLLVSVLEVDAGGSTFEVKTMS